MIRNLLVLLSLFLLLSGCTDSGEVKYTNDNFNKTTNTLAINATNYNANIRSESGQLLRIRVNKGGLYEEPLKYRAIVRLDPRFPAPFLFAVRMDSSTLQYTPSWSTSSSTFTNNISSVSTKYNATSPINVHAGDFVSFKIITPSQFYDSNMVGMTSDLTGSTLQNYNYLDVSSLVTSSGGVDNAIINTSNISGFCSYNTSLCNTTGGYFPASALVYSQLLQGVANFSNIQNINSCGDVSLDNTTLCKFDLGSGLEFRLNSALMKRWNQKFVNTTDNGVANKVYYFMAENDGTVNFTFPTSFSFLEMFKQTVTVTTPDRTISQTTKTQTCEPFTRLCQGLVGCTQDICYYGDQDYWYGTTNIADCAGCDYDQPCSSAGYSWYLYLKNRVNKSCCDNGDYFINLPDSITVNGVTRPIGNVNVRVNNGIVTVLDRLCREVTNTKVVEVVPGTTTTTITPFANQYMSSWRGVFSDSRDIINLLSPSSSRYELKKYAAGRYLFEIDVGSGSGVALSNKLNNIKVRYTIKEGNNVLSSGLVSGDVLEINAPATGNIYLSVENPYSEIKGNLSVQVQTYTASAEVARFLNDELVVPLKEQILNLAANLFGGLVKNGKFILFVQTCLTLYLLFYGFNFALGSVEITINDLLTRVIKILVVGALFSDMSWSFFYDYLFKNFLDTTDKLINSMANDTAIVGNVFGFIDPMLNKYFDKSLWTIIGVYILWAGYGYIFVAGFLIAGIFYFLRAIISIFISFLLSYLSLCVMIAMGPLFITAMLFERTKDYFDNWISVMFGYMIQPFVVLVFMLFIDQITSDFLVNGLLPVRFDSCIYDIGLYTSNPDLDLHFFCVAGYTPYPLSTPVTDVYRVSAVFFCLMKLASNISSLSEAFVDRLTMSSAGQGAASGGGVSHMTGLAGRHATWAGKTALVKTGKTVWKGVKAIGNKIESKFERKTQETSPLPPTDPAKDPYAMQNIQQHEKQQNDTVPEGKVRVKQAGGYDTFEDAGTSGAGSQSPKTGSNSSATRAQAGASTAPSTKAKTSGDVSAPGVPPKGAAPAGTKPAVVAKRPGASTPSETQGGTNGLSSRGATSSERQVQKGGLMRKEKMTFGNSPQRTQYGEERARMLGSHDQRQRDGAAPQASKERPVSASAPASTTSPSAPKADDGRGAKPAPKKGAGAEKTRKTRGDIKKASNLKAKANPILTTKK